MRRAFITGLGGLTLTPFESRFLAATRPAGLILFSRNCDTPAQVRSLIADARAAIGTRDCLVLIDQEGGRVQRLRPPHWRALPPAALFGAIHGADPAAGLAGAHAIARLIAADLAALGINANCTPVLDLPVPGSHDVIGNRAFGSAPAPVIALGRAVAEAHLAGGVLPIVKHIPGHGRALSDSHLDLPVVTASIAELERTDFAPFRALKHLPAAMTAHIVFTAVDPERPLSTSRRAMDMIVRGAIGYDGLVMSDDLSMRALAGDMTTRARDVIAAGCDLALHCNGQLAEMEAVAAAVPVLAGRAHERFQHAFAVTRHATPFDQLAAEALLERLMTTVA